MFGVVQEEKEEPKVRRTSHFHFSRLPFHFQKILPWLGLVILIILLVGYYLYKNYYSNYNYIKVDTDHYLVYTKSSSYNRQNMRNEIPFINIDSPDANLVNRTIEEYAESFLENKDNLFVYDSQVNGEVLSVLIKMKDYSDGYSFPESEFHTYNFDLTTQTLMDDDELLSLFHVTKDDVSAIIQKQFEEYYQKEVEEGYLVAEECNYECFLNWRGVSDYMDDVHYYVRDGSLIAYRGFSIYSVFSEEEFFDDKSYEFKISD